MTQKVSAVRGNIPTEQATAEEVLAWGIKQFGMCFGICTSFQLSGMVIIDMAKRLGVGTFQVFTIDTGRLPEETHEIIERTQERYEIEIEVLHPDAVEVDTMMTEHGEDLFYESVENRHLCCEVRKVRPLQKKLSYLDAWAVGLRRDQAESRTDVKKVEIDRKNGSIYKLSPLADWSEQQVDDYIRCHDVPKHQLFSEGYTSIGCAPCTRATFNGEHVRAGRWWWEVENNKECGIHFNADDTVAGKLDANLQELLHNTKE